MEVGKAFVSGQALGWKPPVLRLTADHPNPFAVAIKAAVPTFVAKGQGIKPFGDLIPKITGMEGFAKALAYQIQRSKAFKLGQLAKGALGPLLRRLRTLAFQLGLALASKLRALKAAVPPEFKRALSEAWPHDAVRTFPTLRRLAGSITPRAPSLAGRAPFARRQPP